MKTSLKCKFTTINMFKSILTIFDQSTHRRGHDVRPLFKPLILMSLLAVSLMFLHCVSVSWASDEAAGAGHELAVIGEAGFKAIDIKISAQKPGGGAPGKDDPVSVLITPSAPLIHICATREKKVTLLAATPN